MNRMKIIFSIGFLLLSASGFAENGEYLWSYEPKVTFASSVVVRTDNSVVLIAKGNYSAESIQAISSDGKLLWKTDIDLHNSPKISLDSDDNVYVATSVGVTKLTREGEIDWEIEIENFVPTNGGIAIDESRNMLYVTASEGLYTGKGILYAINFRLRKVHWTYRFSGSILHTPAISSGGNVIILAGWGDVTSVSPQGTKNWSFRAGEAGHYLGGDVTLGHDDDIYISTFDGVLWSISEAGELNWTFDNGTTNNRGIGSPSISEDGTIYVSSSFNIIDKEKPASDPFLFAINRDGTLIWSFELGDLGIQNGTSKPTLNSNGDLIVTAENLLVSFSKMGELNWMHTHYGAGQFRPPVVAYNGVIHFIKANSDLFAATGSSGPLLEGYWPQAGGNVKRNGNIGAPDFDGDGIINYEDLDDDNDGLSDEAENSLGTDPLQEDTDNDGLSDFNETLRGTDPLVVDQFSLSTPDFNGDGKGDILYRSEGDLTWRLDLMNESGILQSLEMPGMSSCCGWIFNGAGDFNGDGFDDVLIRNTKSGQWYIYHFNGSEIIARGYVPLDSGVNTGVQAVADFNNDGYADVLTRNELTGEWKISLIQNRTVLEDILPPMSQVLTWELVDSKDLDGNGSADILIRNIDSGAWYHYLYDNTDIIARGYINTLTSDLSDQVKAMADFDGDGKADLLLENSESGLWSLVKMDGATPGTPQSILTDTDSVFTFNSANDFDGDGITDISLKDDRTGTVTIYFWNGVGIKSTETLSIPLPENMVSQALN